MAEYFSEQKRKRGIRQASKPIRKVFKFRKTLAVLFLYGRFAFIALSLILQIAIYFWAYFKLLPYINFIAFGSVLCSAIIILYLVNSREMPEFKISWIIPVTLFPVFGTALYFLLKLNMGGKNFKKRIAKVESKIMPYLKVSESVQNECNKKSHIKGMSHFLLNSGGFPPYTNTAVTYYPCGEDLVKDLLSELQKAKKFIFINYFIISIGHFWNAILEILIDKAAEGVDVRVMYDGIGSIFSIPVGYSYYLESVGIKSKCFQKVRPIITIRQNNRDHEKITVIDGKVGFTGGINLDDEYINLKKTRFDYWKDIAIRLNGPGVKNLTALFLREWNMFAPEVENCEKFLSLQISKPRLDSICAAKTNTHSVKNVCIPYEGGFVIPYGDHALNDEDIAKNVYCDILNKAHHYVYITSPYLILDNQIQTALIFAAQRGVEIKIIIPAKADHFVTFCMGRTFVKTLIEKGVKVYEFSPGFIHAKLFVSDDDCAVVGSINMDYRSFYHDFECGVYINDNPVTKGMKNDFENTLSVCKEITLAEYKKIPLHRRFIGRVLKLFAPLF